MALFDCLDTFTIVAFSIFVIACTTITYESSTPQLIISDAKVVKQIKVKDFHIFTNRRIVPDFHKVLSNMVSIAMDTKWKRLRKVISPTFTSGKIRRMKPLIEQCIQNGNDFLETTAKNNELLNLKQFWSRFTLEVIACCCFAKDINSHKDTENTFFKHVTEVFRPPKNTRILSFFLFFVLPLRVVKWLRVPVFPEKSINYLSEVTRQLLIEQRKYPKSYNDFLQLLLEAEKETEETNEVPLTEDEIIANCILFFIAGYETTATLLTWSCFTLAMHPDVQQKVYEELKDNIENVDNIDYDVAKRLPFLDAFVCETLRMYPPFVSTDRMNSVEVELEGTGIKIPPKTVVTTSIYAIHHDPEYFPEPEKFKPERFLGENRESIDPYAFLPFGAGPRNCVAMRFTLLEAKLALINTVMRFKVIKSKSTPTKPIILKATNFMISEDIFVNVEKR